MLKNISKRKKFFLKLSHTNIPFFIVLLFIPSYLNEFSSSGTSWDLYNNMYFGSRLLVGELIWTSEFHDKFPIVQYLFSIPAFFKTIIVWKLISFSLHIIASFLLLKASIKILRFSWNIVNQYSIILPRYISSIYFILPSLLQGYSHFSGTSASFLCISFCIIIIYFDKDTILNPFKSLIFWNCLFLVSISISIRPYYGLIAIFIGYWIPFRFFKIENKKKWFIFSFNYFLKWNICLFVFVIMINFLPYLVTNNFKLAVDGIILNSQNINPQNLVSILRSQKIVLLNSGIKYFIILILSTGIYSFVDYFKDNRKELSSKRVLFSPDFLFLAIISPLLLQTLILSKHFWNHYSLMFLPFFAIFSLGFLTIFFEKIRIYDKNSFDIKSYLLSYLLMILGLYSLSSTFSLFGNLTKKNFYLNDFSKIIASYSYKRFNKISFLDLTSQRIHLKLNHGRAGHPHPAHVGHLEDDWYIVNKIFVPKNFKKKFPLSINELFLNIHKSDKKIIIANAESKISNLLNNSFYFKKNNYLTRSIQEKLNYKAIIYERIENNL